MQQRHPLILTIVKNHNAPEEKRLITIIGSQPFYSSSGANSGMAGTFFPFAGFLTKNIERCLRNQVPCHLIKPSESSFDVYHGRFDLYFYPELREFAKTIGIGDMGKSDPEERCIGFLSRMANMHGLILSMSIGGGVWDTPVGVRLAMFINENYSSLVRGLQTKYQAEINSILDSIKSDHAAINEEDIYEADGFFTSPLEQQTDIRRAEFQASEAEIAIAMNQKLANAACNVNAAKPFKLSAESEPERMDYRLPDLFPNAMLHLDFLNKTRQILVRLLSSTSPESDGSLSRLAEIKNELLAILGNQDPYSIVATSPQIENVMRKFLEKKTELKNLLELETFNEWAREFSLGKFQWGLLIEANYIPDFVSVSDFERFRNRLAFISVDEINNIQLSTENKNKLISVLITHSKSVDDIVKAMKCLPISLRVQFIREIDEELFDKTEFKKLVSSEFLSAIQYFDETYQLSTAPSAQKEAAQNVRDMFNRVAGDCDSVELVNMATKLRLVTRAMNDSTQLPALINSMKEEPVTHGQLQGIKIAGGVLLAFIGVSLCVAGITALIMTGGLSAPLSIGAFTIGIEVLSIAVGVATTAPLLISVAAGFFAYSGRRQGAALAIDEFKQVSDGLAIAAPAAN